MSAALPIAHWQVLARNPQKAAAFYEKCFGWEVDEANALGYRALKNCGVDGGIWPLYEGAPMVQLYLAVPDVDKILRDIEANGGRVILPKQILPDGDEMAVAADPEGIPWGIMRARG